MKKILIVITIFILFSYGEVHAQESNFAQAYQNYVSAVDIYRSAENVYLLKRSEYLRFGTLNAKSEAETATRRFLETRDDVMLTYLQALRFRVQEVPGVDQFERDSVYSVIDPEIGWYTDHKNRIGSAGGLEDLVKDSAEASVRYNEFSTDVSYQALHLVSRAKVLALTGPEAELVQRTQSKINEIRGEGHKNTTVIERWILDAQNELNRSSDKVKNAQGAMQALPEQRDANGKRATFNTSITYLIQAHQHLKDANNFLKEIIREIKTAD